MAEKPCDRPGCSARNSHNPFAIPCIICKVCLRDILDLSLQNFHRVVNVLITPYSANKVLIELARCMALMKNLHTVQISSCSDYITGRHRCRYAIQISKLYKAAFAGYRFPSVRRIAFNSPWEIDLLPCFPEARRVYMTLYRRPGEFKEFWKDWLLERVKQVASHCPKTQVFEWDGERCRERTVADGKSHL